MKLIYLSGGMLVGFIVTYCFFGAPKIISDIQSSINTIPDILIAEVEEKAATLFFVGDIMLGRHVESLMESNGMEYPFEEVIPRIQQYDIAVANFEGTVSKKHVRAPSFSFQFSIKPEYLKRIEEVGFDVLGVANNHVFDYGIEALTNTRSLCTEYLLACGGSPVEIDEHATIIKKVGNTKIGFIFVYAVYNQPDKIKLTERLSDISSKTDMQFVYVHWGEEYELTHNQNQENFAQFLIDQGADAVIGHHPHVVQDVALYKNKPIFYSLGNFIFDQYFNTDVQDGLGVAVSISNTDVVYTVVPFSSLDTHSQPHDMISPEKEILISRILQGISKDSHVNTQNGTITIQKME